MSRSQGPLSTVPVRREYVRYNTYYSLWGALYVRRHHYHQAVFWTGVLSISWYNYQVSRPVAATVMCQTVQPLGSFSYAARPELLVWIENLHVHLHGVQYIHSSMPCNSRPLEGANDPRSIPVNSNLGYFLTYFWATAHRPRRSLRSSFSFFNPRWAGHGLPCTTGGLLPPAASFSLPSLPSIALDSATVGD